MDINENLQLMNVFNKGMNTDTSDLQIGDDQYRFAKNLRYITNTGENTGELRLIEGYKILEYFEDSLPIAATLIRDYAIFVTSGSNGWSIYTYKEDRDPKLEKIFGPCTEALGDYVSLVTRWESDTNIKLYIADGKHQLMSLNICQTYGTDIGDLFSSKIHTFSGFSEPQIIPGTLKPAIVQYAYLLYDKYGKSSGLSQLSYPISLYNADNTYDNGVLYGEHTRSGVSIDITENTDYRYIKIFRITYQLVGQDPIVELIVDDKLELVHGGQYTQYLLRDGGIGAIDTLSLADFIALNKIQASPKYIESKNDYLFASNVEFYADDEAKSFYERWSAVALDLTKDYQDDYEYQGDGNITWNITCEEILDGGYIDKQSTNVKSLARDEIYRYGIVLYDKYGNRWPVKWIADIKTPSANVRGYEPVKYEDGTIKRYAIGITFSVKSLDPAIFPKYEIVRCVRTAQDRSVITLGIIGQVIRNNRIPSNAYHPGFITLSSIHCDNKYGANDNRFVFANTGLITQDVGNDVYILCTPETSYQPDDVLNLVRSNLSNVYIQPIWDSILSGDTVDIKDTSNEEYWSVASNGKFTSFEKSTHPLLFRFPGSGKGGITVEQYSHGGIEISSNNFHVSHPGHKYDAHKYNDGLRPYYTFNFDISNDSVLESDLYGVDPILNVIRINNAITYRNSDETYDINDAVKIKSPSTDNFYKNGVFTYKNDATVIKDTNFINWSAAMIDNMMPSAEANMREGFNAAHLLRDINNESSTWEYINGDIDGFKSTYRYPIGSGGNGLLLSTAKNTHLLPSSFSQPFVTTVVNLKLNVIPYGGFTDYARRNSIYHSFGNAFNSENTQIPTPHSVFDGDVNIQLFYYNALHTWYSPDMRYAPKMSTIQIVPVETSIDLSLDSGDSYKRNPSKNIQDEPVSFKDYVQSLPAYLYNTAYTFDKSVMYSSGANEDFIKSNKYDCRIIYSDQKSNNEYIDSWTNFKLANYIDVDTRYGEITNLRLFKDTLMFWQDNATGVLSVNERTILQDQNDTNIILGNGDVLQRYDYITTGYGMKPNLGADALSNSTLYWWDGYKKEILAYGSNQGFMPMNKIKTVSNYINQNDETKKPSLAYDFKYNEILMSVVGNLPLVYSENIQQFTSVYDTSFLNKVYLPNKLLLTNNNNILEWNEEGEPLYPYLKYVVNKQAVYNKVYDNCIFDGNFSIGNSESDYRYLQFTFHTSLDLHSLLLGEDGGITDREYDFRFAIPRAKDGRGNTAPYGDRLRGKTMQCELYSTSNSTDFSLLYIITKFRISWS